MRLTRTTILFIIIALAITGGALFLLRDTPAPNETPADTGAITDGIGRIWNDVRFADVASWQVTNITEGRDNRFAPDDDGVWQVVGSVLPAEARLAQNAITTALADVVNASSSARFEADDLAPFGLNPPQYSITLYLADNTTRTLAIGTRNPAGTRIYGQVINGDDATSSTVYLLNNPTRWDEVTSLADDLPLLLPPTPIPEPVLQIPGVVFGDIRSDWVGEMRWQSVGGTNWVAERDDDGWRVNGEVGDTERLLLLLDSWRSLRATDAIPLPDEDAQASLEALGLDVSAYRLDVVARLGDEERTYWLEIGALDASQTRYYVRVSRSADILLMPRDAVDTLLLGAEVITPQP
jgi:hypothetical protein